MKTRTLLIATTGTAAALLVAAGLAAADGRGGDMRGAHGEMRMAHADGGQDMRREARGEAMLQMMSRYDTDGDGGLTVDEITAARAAQLKQFDADGDGSLSLDEYETLWLDAMRERMVDRFQHQDADGDGVLTQAEFARDLARMVAHRDRNGDGMLSAEDMRGPRVNMQDGDSGEATQTE